MAAVDVSVHPPFTDLRTVQTLVEKEGIPVALGAQHCSDEDAGARTGEVSPRMLARLGTRYVVVGHSERRTLFGMSDATVASTLRAVLRHDMTPIVCVGETEDERAAGKTEAKLEEQVLSAPRGAVARGRRGPGRGLRALVGHRDRAGGLGHGRRGRLRVHPVPGGQSGWSSRQRTTVRIQYGGSVQADNATDLMAEPNVDGLLVGGASLQAASFLDVIRAGGACYRS